MPFNLTVRLKDEAQQPQVGVVVNIDLYDRDTDTRIIAPVTGADGTVVSTSKTAVTNDEGIAVISLTPNVDIETVNTRYVVTINGVSEKIIMPRRNAFLSELIVSQESFTTPTNTYNELAGTDGVIGRSITRIYTDTLDASTQNNRINVSDPNPQGRVNVAISHINADGESDRDYLNRIPANTSLVLLDQNRVENRIYRVVSSGEQTYGTTVFTTFTCVRAANSGNATFSNGETIVINTNFVDITGIEEQIEMDTTDTGDVVISDATPARSLEAEGQGGTSGTIPRSDHRHQTPAVTSGTSDPAPAAGLNDDVYINTGSNSLWKKVNNVWTKLWAIGDEATDFDPDDYYIHLGSNDIDDDTVSGVVSGGTTTYDLSVATNENAWLKIQLDDTQGHHNVPDDVTYDNSTGSLTLTEGQWLLCGSIKLKDSTIINNERVLGALGIYYDGKLRHANSVYMRNGISGGAMIGTADQVNAIQGLVSVSGVVNADGTKKTALALKLLAQNSNEQVEIVGAHLHAFKIFVADKGASGDSVFLQYSTDANTWVDTFGEGAGIQYFRTAVAQTKPANDSSLWSSAIRVVGPGGGGGNPTDKTTTPEAPTEGGSPGTSDAPSPADHQHPLQDETHLQDQIDGLKHTTSDIERGTTPTTWSDATSDTEGGVAIGGSKFSLSGAQGASYTTDADFSVANRFFAARIPAGADPQQYRLALIGTDNRSYYELVNHLERLGADDDWQYYTHTTPLGAGVISTALQIAPSVAHVGNSTYLGNLKRGKVYNQVKDIGVAGKNITLTFDDDTETMEVESSGGGATLSEATPTNVGGTADAGSDDDASKGDHKHGLEDNAVTTNKIANNAVNHNKLAPGAVGITNYQDSSITGNRIQSNQIRTSHLQNGSVTHEKLANNAVETENIENNAVTDAKIANSTISKSKLEASLVTEIESGGGTGGGATLSDDTPQPVGTTASAGTDTEAPKADHIHNLSNNLTQQLIPAGGTTGQALVKTSDTNYAAAWEDIMSSGGGSGSGLSRDLIATSSTAPENRNFVLSQDSAVERQLHVYERTNVNVASTEAAPATGRGYRYHNVQIALPDDIYLGTSTLQSPISITILDGSTNNVIITGTRLDGTTFERDTNDASNITSLYAHWIASVDFETLITQTGKQTVAWTKIEKQLPAVIGDTNSPSFRYQYSPNNGAYDSKIFYTVVIPISSTDVRIVQVMTWRQTSTSAATSGGSAYTVSVYNPTTGTISDPQAFPITTAISLRSFVGTSSRSRSGLYGFEVDDEVLNGRYTLFSLYANIFSFGSSRYEMYALSYNPTDNAITEYGGNTNRVGGSFLLGYYGRDGMFVARDRLSAITRIGLFDGATTRFILFNNTSQSFQNIAPAGVFTQLPTQVRVAGVDVPINDTIVVRAEQEHPTQSISWNIAAAATNFRAEGTSVRHDDVLPERTAFFVLDTEDENGNVVHRQFLPVGSAYEEVSRFHVGDRIYDYEVIEDEPLLSDGQYISIGALNVPQGTVFKLYTVTLPSGGGSGGGTGGTTVAPHTPAENDTDLTGLDIGGTDYKITDADAQQGLQSVSASTDALRNTLDQLGIAEADITLDGAWEDTTADDAIHVGHVTNPGGSPAPPNDNPTLTVASNADNQVPTLWIPHGIRIEGIRMQIVRGGTVIHTLADTGQHWRPYTQTSGVADSFHLTPYALASDSSDAWITYNLRAGDVLKAQKHPIIHRLVLDSVTALQRTVEENTKKLNALETQVEFDWDVPDENDVLAGYKWYVTTNASDVRDEFFNSNFTYTASANETVEVFASTPIGISTNLLRVIHLRGGNEVEQRTGDQWESFGGVRTPRGYLAYVELSGSFTLQAGDTLDFEIAESAHTRASGRQTLMQIGTPTAGRSNTNFRVTDVPVANLDDVFVIDVRTNDGTVETIFAQKRHITSNNVADNAAQGTLSNYYQIELTGRAQQNQPPLLVLAQTSGGMVAFSTAAHSTETPITLTFFNQRLAF